MKHDPQFPNALFYTRMIPLCFESSLTPPKTADCDKTPKNKKEHKKENSLEGRSPVACISQYARELPKLVTLFDSWLKQTIDTLNDNNLLY